jgi:molybdopterin molybdotransferase
MASEGGPLEFDDVRMRGFARRTPVAEVWRWLEAQVARLEAELVPVAEAAGRVLADPLISPRDIPPFARAMMDGYAVHAADTLGASAYNPIRLLVIGQALPGRPFRGTVGLGQAVQIMTGAPMPDGADAVLPAELAQGEGDQVLAQGEVSPGKHVGQIGEDIRQGSPVFQSGRVLRPQDVGLLASLGLAEVPVVRRPRVRILVTGDELLPAGAAWQPDHIYDANGPMLQALVRRDGGVPEFWGIVPDRPEAIWEALHSPLPTRQTSSAEGYPTGQAPPSVQNLTTQMASSKESKLEATPAEAGRSQASVSSGPESARHPSTSHPDLRMPDVFLISGGSSVGQEDHAPRILAEHGQLVFHGVAMRPSSPTGLGLWEGRPVFLLPGNPVSCLCAYDFFAGRAIRALGGRAVDWPYRRLTVPLARKVTSMIGRLDYLRVRLVQGQAEPIRISGAGILSTTTLADGFVLIPPESEGYPAGTPVEVFLYDS